MSELYAMQRANGDWFALDDHGRFRVPVFRSAEHAGIARLRHSEMECFRPVMLDARTLQELVGDGNDACFWLVNNPLLNLKRSQPVESAQFVLLVDELLAKRARVVG